ncbi:uncharacterized protein SPPG_09187 [Spizellomyces punctatus DAOM BR117]|uniref:Uncharacterized protein n=1 Tax=Spizellomyces punctatus (strain DAOM BR117) TaxID=645134 RepID=A0A0L0HG30_SPIPD|nr:uncharacterized protein SPPG_09187 [Spizellomyces punctatus DAOM BR117]KND00028.1 hypothetical protein SPPG_09187 [Spizellomyces punctatus DAOM BR117]|eukprot:XP_016608067.1 hypothetical protein SPPG_09187 [Spizellomyces punctatus DAOM BR117]
MNLRHIQADREKHRRRESLLTRFSPYHTNQVLKRLTGRPRYVCGFTLQSRLWFTTQTVNEWYRKPSRKTLLLGRTKLTRLGPCVPSQRNLRSGRVFLVCLQNFLLSEVWSANEIPFFSTCVLTKDECAVCTPVARE